VSEDFTDEEGAIRDAAIVYARANRKEIARQLTDVEQYPPDPEPVSVFMAGSPGAGKTEASKGLILEAGGIPPVRIDPDELRENFEAYDGSNSWLFQAGTSILVEKIHDLVLKNGQNFLLDGTLANLEKARQNVARSLKRGRHVQILYVYQEPALAWEFVCAREVAEGRRVLPQHFVEQYFSARQVVNQLKEEFGKGIHVDLLLKNRDNSDKVYRDNIDNVDNHVPEKYSRQEVIDLIAYERS